MIETTHSNKLLGNAVAGMAATGIYLVSRILLTPLVLTYITLAEFGLWSMCFVILSYTSMGAFGVNTTYIRYTAHFHARGQDAEIGRLLSTGMSAMLFFCSCFLLGLFFGLPILLDVFQVEPEMRPTATVLILGTAAVFSLDLTLGGFRSVVEGLQEIALVKKIYISAALVEVAAIIFFLYQGHGVRGMLYAYFIRVALDSGICIIAASRLMPSLRLSPRLINRDHARLLFVFGGKVQIMGAIAIFLTSLDRMVISSTIGLSAAGLFEVGRKFPATAKNVSAAAFGPFLPAAADLTNSSHQTNIRTREYRLKIYLMIGIASLCLAFAPLPWLQLGYSLPSLASSIFTALCIGGALLIIRHLISDLRSGDLRVDTPLRRLYLQGLRHMNLIGMTIFAFLVAIAEPLMIAWMGEEYADTANLVCLLAVGNMIQQSTGPVTLIFRGIDRCGREFELLIVQLILALVWIPAGVISWGLIGAAIAITAVNALAAFFFFWRSNHLFQVGFQHFVSHTLKPTLLPATVAAAVYLVTRLWPCSQQASAIIQVIVLGCGYLCLIFLLAWKLLLTDDEKTHVLALSPFRRPQKQPL